MQRARSTCEAVRCQSRGRNEHRAFGTVPALRSGMKNAAPRPGHVRDRIHHVFSIGIYTRTAMTAPLSLERERGKK